MKGEVRNPTQQWLISALCFVYVPYWWYTVGNELKNYLGNEELNPTMDALVALLCFPYVYYLPIKYGTYFKEAQQRAGLADAEDQGTSFALMMLLCAFGIKSMQEELNKVWESGGGAPATF